jgi:O-acetyl-ADP-ribose deacetylase (regulator of RNase III)
MIKYRSANLLDSEAQALVNTVNTVGVMGKGIALQFKNQYPNNYRLYAQACKSKEVQIGKLFVTEDTSLHGGNKVIVNFPTKTDWRKPSEYNYIEEGLRNLSKFILDNQIKSIAIPPLGAGHGGLEWEKVKSLMEKYLSDIDCEVFIYQPNAQIKEVLKKERVKLTPARAMLLDVLFDLVASGEFVSEFAAEKIAYFLQRFGAKPYLKLDFQPNFYGPYSGKVKHVLYYLNGSYITGYSSMDRKAFEELGLMVDAEGDVDAYLSLPENAECKEIVRKTKLFMSGFYSAFGMELLSTIDFIRTEYNAQSLEAITYQLETWSSRKKTKFSNPRFVKIAVKHLETFLD